MGSQSINCCLYNCLGSEEENLDLQKNVKGNHHCFIKLSHKTVSCNKIKMK